jgi:hypothetical protein
MAKDIIDLNVPDCNQLIANTVLLDMEQIAMFRIESKEQHKGKFIFSDNPSNSIHTRK